MKHLFSASVLFASCAFLLSGCKKDDDSSTTETRTNQQIQSDLLRDFSTVIAFPVYQQMENQMTAFYNACTALQQQTDQANLENARNAWKTVRGTWEKSESFLFGPVSTNNIDPSTDTWPVDYNALDSLLNTSNAFTQVFVQSLGDELKGYHPSEYLLWGSDGNKTAAQFTARELEYLIALSADLQIKATALRNSWDPAVNDNYSWEITNAGNNLSVYPSQKSGMEEIVNAMAGICDEVANGKIGEPFTAADPSLEESPFSNNSLADFKNNIMGVEMVYHAKFNSDGTGLEDFLKNNNLTLHNKIVNQLNNALTAFNGITVPFGRAITSQPTQVQNLIDRINELKTTLEDELLPFIQITVTE